MFFSKIVAALVAAAAMSAGVAHWHHHDAQHDTGFKAYGIRHEHIDGITA